MKVFSKYPYDCISTITHQGLTLAFAARKDENNNNVIYEYRVLDLQQFDEAAPLDEDHWAEVQTLKIPTGYRPAGMNLLSIPSDSPLQAMDTQFSVFTDEKFIYLFRESPQGTVYMNRYVFNKTALVLLPAWETRFQRSEDPDYSFKENDTIGYTNMDGKPFEEPTSEFTTLKPLTGSSIVAFFTRNHIQGSQILNLAIQTSDKTIQLYSFPQTESGLPILEDSKIIAPTNIIQLSSPAKLGSPVATTYTQQQPIAHEGSQMLSRSARVMVAFGYENELKQSVACLDIALDSAGSLTKIPDPLPLPDLTDPGTLPVLNTDSKGLNIRGAILDYLNSDGALSLLSSTNGDLFLYLNAKEANAENGEFGYCIYNTQVLRSIYRFDTNTKSAYFDALAKKAGTSGNGASLEFEEADGTSLGLLTLIPNGASGLQTEEWLGLPSHIEAASSILKGEASNRPPDQKVRTASMAFFDYTESWILQSTPLLDGSSIVSGSLVAIQNMPKKNSSKNLQWSLEDSENANCFDTVFSFELNGITVKETWKNVSIEYEAFQKTINGFSDLYNYATDASFSHAVVRLWCGTGEIWFISLLEDVKQAWVEVVTVDPDSCEVMLRIVKTDDTVESETLLLPRDPASIISAINGEVGEPSKLFRCHDAGATQSVESQRVKADGLDAGSQLATLVYYGKGVVSNGIQSLSQKFNLAQKPESSKLFDFAFTTPNPDTSNLRLSSGTAISTQIGENAAWVTPEVRPSLGLDYSAIEIDAKPNLDIKKNLTLEAWVKPQSPFQDRARIINHVSRNTDDCYSLGIQKTPESEEMSIYGTLMGSAVSSVTRPIQLNEWNHIALTYRTGQSLQFDGTQFLDCGNGQTLNTGNQMTLEIWVEPGEKGTNNRTLISKYGLKESQRSYLLTEEGDEYVFRFNSSMLRTLRDGKNFLNYTCRAPVGTRGEWNHVAVVVLFENVTDLTDGIKVKTTIFARLFVNGEVVGNLIEEEILNETLQLNTTESSLYIGGMNTPEPMLVEEFKIADVRIWNAVLQPSLIRQNYIEQRVAESSDTLISYWKMNEGEGREVADVMKRNNGLLNVGNIWRLTRMGADWQLFINGNPLDTNITSAEDFGGYKEDKTFLGVESYSESIDQPYEGLLDEVRIWSSIRTQEQIVDTMYASLDGEEKNLEGYWSMDKGSGTIVADTSDHGNTGSFAPLPPQALYTDFTLADNKNLEVTTYLTHMDATGISSVPVDGKFQFRISTEKDAQIKVVWTNNAYTMELQIGEESPIPLESGIPVDFPAAMQSSVYLIVKNNPIESIKLRTVKPNFPTWNASDGAPVGSDAPIARELPGGRILPENVRINGTPYGVEYNDLQKDSDGNLLGVMKRAHAFRNPSNIVMLVTSFRVGETDLQYVGQIQTKPTLIGYIEGPPPVPSENLTVNPGEVGAYNGTSSISLSEDYNEQFTYAGSSNSFLDMSLESKVGLYFGTESSAGIGAEVEILKIEGKIGLHLKAETSLGWTQSVQTGVSSSESFKESQSLRGSWEIKKDYDGNQKPRYLNPHVGRRYVPNNMGYALVKSGTSDLYAVRLRGTGAVVSYTIFPNKDIPKDWNIIMFPINPSYVKNGTLDGLVGLVADPNYPNATKGVRGSYFKPVEAYALKQKIDQESETVKGYYTQQNTDPVAAFQAMDTPEGDLLRNWGDKISKRSLVNSYVWSSDGGLYSHETQFSDIRQESQGGEFTIAIQVGLYGSLEMRAGGVGLDAEADVLFGPRLEYSVVSTEEYNDTFQFNAEVVGESWLNQFNPATEEYEPFDAPGKVDGYRFMSYYLAPESDNFKTFFDKVVDPNWLNNGSSPNANALLSAADQETAPWRILHRVTYVSRVPPEIKPSPDLSLPPAVQRPININLNQWVIGYVDSNLGGGPYTRGRIEAAVDQTLYVDLPAINPYWKQFMEEAKKEPEGEAGLEFNSIQRACKAYMYDYYITEPKS